MLVNTEIKKKGRRELDSEEYAILSSGVDKGKRAEVGVGCVINRKCLDRILN